MANLRVEGGEIEVFRDVQRRVWEGEKVTGSARYGTQRGKLL